MPTAAVSKVSPRMRNLHRALLAGSLSLSVGFVAGCGGSGAGLLTSSQASALQSQLNQVSSALSAGHCANVQTATRSLASDVANLPDTVNANLRGALTSEANQVSTLSVSQCHPTSTPASTSTGATGPTPSPTTTSTSTTSTPTTTSTTHTNTNTTTTPTTPTTPATTPTTPGTNSGGGGLSGGSGGGAGGGGGAGAGGGANGNGNG